MKSSVIRVLFGLSLAGMVSCGENAASSNGAGATGTTTGGTGPATPGDGGASDTVGGAAASGNPAGGTGPVATTGGTSAIVPTDQDIYVAPDGSDSNPGTVAAPTTLYRAVTLVTPGHSIFMRGGTYPYVTTVIIAFGNNGTADQPKRLFNYPGESPSLDFSQQITKTSTSDGQRGLELHGAYWHVKGLEIHDSGDNGLYVTGSYNTIELCVFHNNRDSGLQLGGRLGETATPEADWPKFNTIVNCDSYGNFDPYGNGGNADGFAPKLNVGEGNVFRGCRAWHNSDDGWDLYNRNGRALKPVTIDQCWAFDNGYTAGGYLSTDPPPVLAGQGNGNGFKLGGGDGLAANHVITRSVAFGNRVRGFDENNNVGNITVKNDTAWLNGTMNFAFSEGGVHTFINNVSYLSKSEDEHVGSDVSNAWTGVTAGDFVSLDRSLATAPRQADGSLPEIDLLKLAPGSRLIDAGSTEGVTLPYGGAAPDLGAFETK